MNGNAPSVNVDDVNVTRRATGLELIAALGALIALAVIQLIATRRLDLLTHALWLDETFTSFIINDHSFTHMLRAIAGGIDTNPPTLYLLYWPIARLLGGLSDPALRILALAWMLIGLTGVYAICRRSFAIAPSVVAVLALWAHPLIVDQAFEARYYGPWFALTVWFAYLQRDADADRHAQTTSLRALRYLLAILATCIHYFGAITMILIAATDFLVHRRFKRILPALVSLLVLGAVAPYFISGQRASLSIPTWIEPVDAQEIRDDVIAAFGAPSILFVILLAWICRLLTKPRAADAASPSHDFRALMPLSSLLLLPVAIVVVSIVVQPALVLRYLILAIAPLAPMLAAMIECAGRRAKSIAVIGLFAISSATLVSKSHATRGLDDDFRSAIAAIDDKTGADSLIVFKRRREMYPVLHLRPDLRSRCAQLDFDDATLPNVSRLSRYERDMGRKAQRIYPDLRMIRPDELMTGREVFVIALPAEYDELQKQLPGFHVADRDAILHRVTVERAR